jgi:16S rRNA (guanine966-N2)-methyltransferase
LRFMDASLWPWLQSFAGLINIAWRDTKRICEANRRENGGGIAYNTPMNKREAKPGRESIEATKSELRIVAGTLRGRKIVTIVHDDLRPTPQRVRESLFSILGNAVPGRVFWDIFAGTGIVGLEAISRGAKTAHFVEADGKNAALIQKYAEAWGVGPQVDVLKADVYRWAERWPNPTVPVTLFLSPPFPDLAPEKVAAFLALVETLKAKLPDDSVIALQLEDGFPLDQIANVEVWDIRKYGRNILAFYSVDLTPVEPATT